MTNPFKDLFKLGERFNYLGGTMLVIEFINPYDSDTNALYKECGGERIRRSAKMVTIYRDNNGILREQVFKERDIPALLAETTSPERRNTTSGFR